MEESRSTFGKGGGPKIMNNDEVTKHRLHDYFWIPPVAGKLWLTRFSYVYATALVLGSSGVSALHIVHLHKY